MPDRKLKLIWDFYGPDALAIAKHHEVHLKDYVQQTQAPVLLTGYEALSEAHAIAFLVVAEGDMKPLRDALKPKRGAVYVE